MNKDSTVTTEAGVEREVPASISPGQLRALSTTLGRARKLPAKLGPKQVTAAVAATEELAELAPATAAQLLRGLRNLQLVTPEDEPTQAYLQLLRGNRDADWKDFIDAHFDYLLENEVSLLDLTAGELQERLTQHHPGVGRSTLAATGRLIRGMMTRSFEPKASEQEAAVSAPPQKRAPAKTQAPPQETASPAVTVATSKTLEQATEPASPPVPAAAPASLAPARPRRARQQTAKTTPEAQEAAPEVLVPLSGNITLPLGGSNSATLSWSITTFDAASMEVVTSQLELAAHFIRELKDKAG